MYKKKNNTNTYVQRKDFNIYQNAAKASENKYEKRPI